MDEFSRFSNTVIIKRKSTDIIKMFLKYCISLFGSPNTIFSESGGEFVSKEFIDFCENFNMKIKATAAEAPWSNGICERHNAIITDIILKVRNDTKCEWETALAWAISAKNYFINVSGFSLHRIVLGKNINLPSIFNDQPSADLPQNEIITEHWSVLHATRQAFIATESSKKLKAALQKEKNRQNRKHFDHGSQVYYKQNGDQKWKGPGKVVGHDGAVIFIKHGGSSSKLIVYGYS